MKGRFLQVIQFSSRRSLLPECARTRGKLLVLGRSQLSTTPASRFQPASEQALQSSRLILTDAMALLYRSHFAFAHDHRLRTSAGRDTTVEFGFLATVISLLELVPHPTHFAVVFDASGKTFRHEIYQGYKGHRPPTPEEIINAIPVIQRILGSMEISTIRVPGVEADDVIGTLAMKGLQNEMTVAIASPDKDFFQLLRPGLILLRPPKKSSKVWSRPVGSSFQKYSLVPYTVEDFEDEWHGLVPSQFVDVLALMGDSSDNVPGVTGIGPKTATALLKEYGSLEDVLAMSNDVKPKRAATALSSQEGAAAARLSKKLVQLQTDLEVPATTGSLEKLKLRVPQDRGEKTIELLRELEFSSHEQRIKQLWDSQLY